MKINPGESPHQFIVYMVMLLLSAIAGPLEIRKISTGRQFITRGSTSHNVLNRLENLLNQFFGSNEQLQKGLPTVQFIAEKLNMSPNYLSSLLKQLTGLNTQQHIHEKLISVAKEKLSATDLTVSQIAYHLGFEHVPSFSKLFKQKTTQSPVFFRQSFKNG